MDEKNKKRAERRINRNKKGKEGFKNYHAHDGQDWTEHEIKRRTGIYSKTRTFCSNPLCCGNSRRIRGATNLTIQELKSLDDENDYDLISDDCLIDELDNSGEFDNG